MEPEARRSPYFGSGVAHQPINVPPQPTVQPSIWVKRDEASEQTNSDCRQRQSMQQLQSAVIPPGPGFRHQPLNGPQPVLHQPVTQDGAPENWMPLPQGPPRNCPPGLEYLSMVDQLLVHQKADYWEGFTGFETANKYKITNNLGQVVYYAKEKLLRDGCGYLIPSALDLTIFDNSRNQVVMHLYTPFAEDECCIPSLQDLEVSAPPGNLLGTVHRKPGFWGKSFDVKNAQRDTVLRIKGPSVFDGNSDFGITTPDGLSNIGSISKKWSGFVREIFSDADDFTITFPVDLDVKTKATLLGGLFFIDILFYETGRKHY